MKIVVANWKMNPLDSKRAVSLVEGVKSKVKSVKDVRVIICPPYIYLKGVKKAIEKSKIQLGAQDIYWKSKGAFTGAISGKMVKNVGCRYVIVGHSERRIIFKEDDRIVNKKLKSAFREGLNPILCVGERAEQFREGKTEEFVTGELRKDLLGIDKGKVRHLIIAYEPIWAIGQKKPAEGRIIFRTISSIRKFLSNKYGEKISSQVNILYGGSANSHNSASIVSETGVDGLLIGRASLRVKDFVSVIKSL